MLPSHGVNLSELGEFETDSIKIFRIYRDVRFSSDPTPYKVRYLSNNCCICGVLITSRQPSQPLGHALVEKATTLHITCRSSPVKEVLSVSSPSSISQFT